MPTTTKLPPAMTHVLRRMAQGWELGISVAITSDCCWLQQNGLGHGGATEHARPCAGHTED